MKNLIKNSFYILLIVAMFIVLLFPIIVAYIFGNPWLIALYFVWTIPGGILLAVLVSLMGSVEKSYG